MDNLNTVARGLDYPAYSLSIRTDFKLKNNPNNPSKDWKTARLDAVALASHCSTGFPVSVSQYKGGYRNQENALETWMLGLDFEKKGFTVEAAAEHHILSQVCAVIMPTASDAPDNPRTRAFTFLGRSVSGVEYKRLCHIFSALLPDTGLDPAPLHNAAYFFGSEPDPARVFVAPHNVLRVDDFLTQYAGLAISATRASHTKRRQTGAADGDADDNLKQLLARRDALLDFEPVSFFGGSADVLDKLQYVVRLWHVGRVGFSLWWSMWVSAHRASKGDPAVCKYILAQAQIWAEYGTGDQAKFEADWEALPDWEDNRITAATLKWLAQKVGWGRHNPYGRLTTADIVIDIVELSDGIDWGTIERGSNVAIKSQTGSGKTKGNVALIKHLQPTVGRAVVISPFINLCHGVAAGMSKLGVTAVSYDEKGADGGGAIVVRTPQNTLKRLPDPENMDYVFIEEIHAILKHLSTPKSEGGHMRDDERTHFRLWLTRALRCETCTVVMVDAGLSDVSVGYLRAIAPVTVVHNKGRRQKAAVTRVDEDYAIERAIGRLKAGERVVITAPKKETCERAHLVLARHASTSVVITADTKGEAAVQGFRADVEAGAAATQLVIYNAAFGTGVSIEHTTPDLIIQYADFLSGEDWIQHLNRYRAQREVLLVLNASRQRRRTYGDLRAEYLKRAKVEIEALGLNWRSAEKNDTTAAFDRLRVGLEADKRSQLVDPAAYYAHVLAEDGRQYFDEVEIEHAHPSMRAAVDLIRARDERMMREWQSVAPIDPSRGVERGVTRDQLARGYLHHKLLKLTNGYLPPNVEPEVIAKTLLNQAPTIRDLRGAMTNEEIYPKNMEVALNPNKGTTELQAKAAKRTLVQASRTLIAGLFDEITPEILAANADLYVTQIGQLRRAYDVLVERPRNRWSSVVERSEGNAGDLAVTLLKYVLETVGLKLEARVTRPRNAEGKQVRVYTHYIANAEEAYNALLWSERGYTGDENLEHVARTFGMTRYDAQIVGYLNEIWKSREAKQRLAEADERGLDLIDAIRYALPSARISWT